jgi:glycosyltransferase involved in cell wall biosynthesis
MPDIGIIAIGRNEGERLRRCLASVLGRGWPVVYVDSKSTDGSAELARLMGAEVVDLDMSLPFSAARARNEGFERLTRVAPDVTLVQFVDGDCEVVNGWIDRAAKELETRPDAAIVCGRRRERFPDASIFNRLADLEWDTPVGEAESCGGDAMMRVEAFRAAGGFDASVAAGEEPELCQRLREKGWKVVRVDAEMTLHDSAMLSFGQWWKRTVRSGYGAMDVATRFGHRGLFVEHVASARRWAVQWPLVVLVTFAVGLAVLSAVLLSTSPAHAVVGGALLAGIVALALPLQMLRIAIRTRRRTPDWRTALAYGFLTMIGKWANYAGQSQYRRDRRAGRNTRLIEYKQAPRFSPGLTPSPSGRGRG